jgi:hypothetical protein
MSEFGEFSIQTKKTIFQGAAVACLIMQSRIAKLDENGTAAKGTFSIHLL